MYDVYEFLQQQKKKGDNTKWRKKGATILEQNS